MILPWIILVPLLGALAAWAVGRTRPAVVRWIAAFALVIDLVLALLAGARTAVEGEAVEIWFPWIPQLGSAIHLAMDGVSFLMVVLTCGMGLVAVAASWTEHHRHGAGFYACLLATLAGILGAFLAVDLLVFFIFYEVMLVPMYFLIALWGGGKRTQAALKFFIFTQSTGLLMLVGILGLYFVHGTQTGLYSFDYAQLLGTRIAEPLAGFLFLAFFIAFAVKLPVVPLHSWQPDAYAASPTAATIVLAALMAKVGAYGLLRLAVPLFPAVAARTASWIDWLAVAGILYGAWMAFGQRDLKRLIAYSSISHLGFVVLGAFAFSDVAYRGAVMVMVCHGISVGGLFLLAKLVYQRTGTRDLRRLGGIWKTAPRMGGVAMVFTMATLGLPGLGNFIGEFLVLLGTYASNPTATIAAAVGVIFSAIYALWMMQQVFLGPRAERDEHSDLSIGYAVVTGLMIAVLVWLGLFPQPVLTRAQSAWTTFAPQHLRGIRQSNAAPPEIDGTPHTRTAIAEKGGRP